MKVPLYARHGIPETWVIHAVTRHTRVFRRPAGGVYADETAVEVDRPLSVDGVPSADGARILVDLRRLLPPVE